LSDDSIERYLRPLVKTEQRTRDLQRFLAALTTNTRLPSKRNLNTASADAHRLGTDDVYFDVKWSHWLAENIPGTRRRVELQGARISSPRNAGRSSTKNYALTGNGSKGSQTGSAMTLAAMKMTDQTHKADTSGRCTFRKAAPTPHIWMRARQGRHGRGVKAIATSSWSSPMPTASPTRTDTRTLVIENLRRIVAERTCRNHNLESGYGDAPGVVAETIALAIEAARRL